MKQPKQSSLEHTLRALPPPWNSLLPLAARIFVWGMLLGLFYILRSFFLLIFLTFVFAYIQNSSIQRIDRWIQNRTLRVFVVAMAVLSTLIAVTIFLVPKVKSQTAFFGHQFSSYIQRADTEIIALCEKYPFLKEAFPGNWKEDTAAKTEADNGGLKNSPIISLLQQMAGFGEEGAVVEKVNEVIDTLGRIPGSYMRINPVVVLIILTISGKLFHFWGLLLGVPICTYVFGHAIRKKTPGDDSGGFDQVALLEKACVEDKNGEKR